MAVVVDVLDNRGTSHIVEKYDGGHVDAVDINEAGHGNCSLESWPVV
jgi:hypothetical protein